MRMTMRMRIKNENEKRLCEKIKILKRVSQLIFHKDQILWVFHNCKVGRKKRRRSTQVSKRRKSIKHN